MSGFLAQAVPNEIVVPISGSSLMEIQLAPGILDSFSHLTPSQAANRCAAATAKQYPQVKIISIKLAKNQQAGCFVESQSICLWECKSALVSPL